MRIDHNKLFEMSLSKNIIIMYIIFVIYSPVNSENALKILTI